jgi:HAD superfamily hydrolase (TIGR01490 family)
MRLALFDLDGTVLRGNSWHIFYWWALRRWPLRAPGLLVLLFLRRLRLIEARTLQQAALRALAGADPATINAIGRQLFAKRLRELIRPAAKQEIARRFAEGHQIVLATAAFDFLAAPIAEELGVKQIIATRLEFAGGVCAGRSVFPEPRGVAKAEAVRAHFNGGSVDWRGSCAFTDEREDLPLLGLVGDPVFVTSARVRPDDLPANVRVENWEL